MAVRTRLYTRGSQAFSRTLTKPPIQVTHQGRNITPPFKKACPQALSLGACLLPLVQLWLFAAGGAAVVDEMLQAEQRMSN